MAHWQQTIILLVYGQMVQKPYFLTTCLRRLRQVDQYLRHASQDGDLDGMN